jgi:hypothetical protein
MKLSMTVGVMWIGLLASFSADAKTVQLLEIQGEPKTEIKIERAGKEIKIKAADAIEAGDVVFAGENQTLVLQFDPQKEDTATTPQDVLTLSPGTQFEINPESEDLGQSGTLKDGSVKGGFHRPAHMDKTLKKKKLRFTLRTRSAVMGVRGTEFLVSGASGSGNFNFFTTQGAVEVAKSEQALAAGESTALEAGKMLQATPAGITPPKAFDLKDLPHLGFGSDDKSEKKRRGR